MPVSEATYERVALEDPEGKWELYCGQLRSKPAMTAKHNQVGRMLGFWLQSQLGVYEYVVSVNGGRAARPTTSYFIPDVMVVPAAFYRRLRDQTDRLEVYSEPLPLVVEVWSPSTGEYDVDEKLPEYQRRGDLEIWRIHPYERTLIVWQRQADGTYADSLYRAGTIRPASLPGVTIDLDALFEV
ncbi:MAG: Uma2 family endonuclease [Dehalococcoidia bacterium]